MINRRDFLRLGTALASTAALSTSLWPRALRAGGALATAGESPYGPLQPADANGIMLPVGFQSRVLARGSQVVPGTSFVWHTAPDGGAVFPMPDGGWAYVSNSERVFPSGGASALRFDASGEVVGAYTILSGTLLNCAGGATPWGTWLSCEEHPAGLAWECDPAGLAPAAARPGLGTFQHEAAAVDPNDGRVYLSEDVSDGRFYRFTPDTPGDLSAGLLEMASLDGDGFVTWLEVPSPNPDIGAGETPTRQQLGAATTAFAGGEGLVYSHGQVYLTTKGDERVWAYDVAQARMMVLYDAALETSPVLTGVDNITATKSGRLIVAEDTAGNMELVMITTDLQVAPIVRVLNQTGSEIAGPALDPFEVRLYFSSQRGGGPGITYEILGPFRRVFGC